MSKESQLKLRFQKSGKVYSFCACPVGISCAPRIYTKLMKPVYASLRMLGQTNSGYIDDSLLEGDTADECAENIQDTVSLMTELVFVIYEKKTVLVPTRKITFLGNNIDSEAMTVTLPETKVQLIVQECRSLNRLTLSTIQQVARVLGLMVSSFSAVQYGPLFYRCIEREKIMALKHNRGDYDCLMHISEGMKLELKWWVDNLAEQKRVIDHGNPDMIVTTDASNSGWGAICKESRIGGRWNELESTNHINYLELIAVSHGLKSFCKFSKNLHVQIKSDNTSCISNISNMGSMPNKKRNAPLRFCPLRSPFNMKMLIVMIYSFLLRSF